MADATTNHVHHVPGRVGVSVEKKSPTAAVPGVLIGLAVIARLTIAKDSIRLDVLRGILILLALGEGVLGGASQVFYPRRSAEREGRRYDPTYQGLMQDFGFYNFAFALLVTLAAIDPMRNVAVVAVAIVLLTIHGVTHVCRYFGLYYGGGTPNPARPRQLDLQQGLILLAGAIGLTLFFP